MRAPEEQRAVAGHVLEEPVVAVGHHLHMLGGDVVGHRQHLVIGVAQDHLAVVLPAHPGGAGGGQDLEDPVDLGQRRLGQLARIGHQHGGRVVAMLGLPQQVGRDQLRVDGVVGDHHGLGRPGEQVDPHPPVELALGLGHEGVAGADEHVDGLDRFRAHRHRADGLDAAQDVDLVRAAEMHRGDRPPVAARPLKGGAAGDDARHARPPWPSATDICAEATIGNLPPGT